MALSAIKPGGTIHPILEPIYTPRKDRSDSPWIEDNSSSHMSGRRGPAYQEAPPVAPATLKTTPVTEAVLPNPTVEKIQPADTVRLLPPSSAIETEIKTNSRQEARDQAKAQPPLAKSKDKAEGTGRASHREQSSDPIPGTVSPRLEQAMLPIAARRPASPGRGPIRVFGLEKTQMMTPRFQRVEPAVREPDEIQIHIGRIEVTAVPPAPAPPAAKPQRNVPSLDEYLRRRDRRAS
jgi:hypothetical protein